ncbi:MAG: hypothetical protein ACOC2H_09280 [Spirochaetota bacterium]
MVFMIKQRLQTAFLCALIGLPGCAGLLERPDYTVITRYSGTSSETLSPDIPIDTGATYAAYLVLVAPEGRVRISMNASAVTDDTVPEDGKLLPYFIVEKYHTLTTEESVSEMFTVIGANHDSDWTIRTPVELRSPDDDPLAVLTDGIYRIRFTVFSDDPFTYEITVSTNHEEAVFAPTLEQAKQKLEQSKAEAEQ